MHIEVNVIFLKTFFPLPVSIQSVSQALKNPCFHKLVQHAHYLISQIISKYSLRYSDLPGVL